MKHPIFTKQQVATNLKYGAAAWVTTGMFLVQQAFCDAGWLSSAEQVDIASQAGNIDPNNIVNNIVTLVCAIISMGGIVTIAQGYGTYSQGHSEDNSATESKGIRKMLAGLVAAAAPWVIKWILGTG